jgi:hypothetical protein
VVSGPLASLEGIVSMVADGRMSVLFDLLGKPLHLTLGLGQISAYQLSVISYQLSVISYQLSVISYQLSVISYQLSVISY